MMKIYSRSLILSIAIFFSGCYTHKNTIPKGLFNDVMVFEKPQEAIDYNDILKSYINLFDAYQNNLLILNTIEKLDKK